MTRATDHVTDHNELVGLLLTEATRFGYAPVSNGPFTYDDPGHIDEHNLYVDDLKAIATIAGRTFTAALPDTANHGDPGHPADHDLLRAAVTEIQAWPAWNDATGGTVTTVDNYNGTGERWRVHTFTGNGSLDVSLAVQPFHVFAVGGGGGSGGGNFPGAGGGGGLAQSLNHSLPVQAHAVSVGSGGGITTAGNSSSLDGVTGLGGGHGGNDGNAGQSFGCGGGGGSNNAPPGSGSQGGNGGQATNGGAGGGMGGSASGQAAGPRMTLPTGDHISRGGYPRGVTQSLPASTYGGGGSYDNGSAGQGGVVIVAYRIG